MCLLDWGDLVKHGPPSCSSNAANVQREQVMSGKATVTLCQEAFHKFGNLASRVINVMRPNFF